MVQFRTIDQLQSRLITPRIVIRLFGDSQNVRIEPSSTLALPFYPKFKGLGSLTNGDSGLGGVLPVNDYPPFS